MKKLLIVGNQNVVNYLCPLIKENKLWLGVSPRSMNFVCPNGDIENVNACWFTNVEHKKRNEVLELTKKYLNEYYQKYDNYNAIEVSKVCEIPMDYDGVMGVPITFLGKYNPNQFEIIGITYSKDRNEDIEKLRTDPKQRHVGIINGKEKYPRILIRHKRKEDGE